MDDFKKEELIKRLKKLIFSAHFRGNIDDEIVALQQNLRAKGIDLDEIMEETWKKFDNFLFVYSQNNVIQTKLQEIDFSSFEFISFTEENQREQIIQQAKLIPFTIKGDSMVDAGLEDGDIVLVEKADFVDNSIYVVSIDGNCFVKKVEKNENGYWLHSQNQEYKSIFIPLELKMEFIGKVKFVLKKIE